jgi:hypothetical protein
MKKYLPLLLINLIFNLNSYSIYISEWNDADSINDGPYIFNVHDKLKVKWIENNVYRVKTILPKNFDVINKKFKLHCKYKDLTDTYLLKSNPDQSYYNIDSISVISDIHGAYDSYINLLKAIGVIDKNLNWKFGTGHLVVLGDSFDRGNMVTEVLWHLFGLEKQAAKAGGMVHVLLGNHGLMVLNKNEKYINAKYKNVEIISNTLYCDLYSENSVLGRWLRSKPVMITINNIIFVHAGISTEMIQRNLKMDKINRLFSDSIIGKDIQSINEDEDLKFLNGTDGPLWYRGYFTDTSFCESKLDSILDFYDKDYIVIGHTAHNEIRSLYNNKILGIDAGLMYEQPGEMLIYKNGSFYRGFVSGERIKL